ncbi:MAG: hypothetical protein HZA22_11540 [Nitrospirae bacterium]|nr:hypothetical protein [Nitrospirota bacterium]
MKKDDIVKNNLDMLNEFMKYAFKNPDILDRIPKGAELVILPENEPRMYKENMKLVEKLKKAGKPFVVVRMKLPEAIPEPTIELMAG